MRCPTCGTSHPPTYEQCVSCGDSLFVEDPIDLESDQEARSPQGERASAQKKHRLDVSNRQVDLEYSSIPEPSSKRRSKSLRFDLKSNVPSRYGIAVAATILLVTAGATFFFLTRQPEQNALLAEGLKQIQLGQYAFAVETLTRAQAQDKKDPKILLALAKAYLGSDQIEKAWDAISQAQQLGKGVTEDPDLASQLANYYKQRGQWEKAINLLRPLAQKNVAGKRAELADLAALWGDNELREGHADKALLLWEEVKSLNEGSRYTEADARLATIYKKLSDSYAGQNKDKEALSYLSKLNAIADNPRNYEMASDLYARSGQLELAIDQLRKASNLQGADENIKRKLAALLTRRGKELMDNGDNDTGYAYLQQAKSMDPSHALPSITLKSVKIDQSGPRIAGQVYNPTQDAINALTMRVDLVDTRSGNRVLWTREQKVIDEYVAALGAKDSRNVEFNAGIPVKGDGSFAFQVFFDGKLYNTYPIGKKAKGTVGDEPAKAKSGDGADTAKEQKTDDSLYGDTTGNTAPVPGNNTTTSSPSSTSTGASPAQTEDKKAPSPEEKTLQDLNF